MMAIAGQETTMLYIIEGLRGPHAINFKILCPSKFAVKNSNIFNHNIKISICGCLGYFRCSKRNWISKYPSCV